MRPLLVVALCLMSGCAASAGPNAKDAAAVDGTAQASLATTAAFDETYSWGFTAGAATPAMSTWVIPKGDPVTITIPSGAASLDVDVSWTCVNSPACSLDVGFSANDGSATYWNSGADSVTLSVSSPAAGDYTFGAFPLGPAGAAVDAQLTIHVVIS
jgi:hypothetical protein